ncbi:hypothetical protein ACH9L7_01945 [Haloferax sp. S1W]|uniref:hypothetical protein n=1 Tax=Haloferax sp. S1W TaxID=3377110 RepID=UPI0037C99B64
MSPKKVGGLELTRRKALSTLGAAVTMSGLGTTVQASESKVDHPMLVSGDNVVKWLSVPADWEQHRKHAIEALGTARDRLGTTPKVVGTELEQSRDRYGGHNGFQISVILDKDDKSVQRERVRNNLPEEVDDIPISSRDSAESFAGSCDDQDTVDDNCTNNESTDTVQGGQNVGWVEQGNGTSCCGVKYNGEQCLLTAAHNFYNPGNCSSSDENDLIGRVADAAEEEIGEVIEADIKGDWALIDDSRGGDYPNEIDDNDEFPSVKGHVTKPTLDHWASDSSNSPCVYNMGRQTGLTSGKIMNTNANWTAICSNMRNHGVRSRANFADGDSGSPTYHLEDGDAYIISVTGYGYDPYGFACGQKKSDKSGGIGAYWLAENKDVKFGENSTV